LNGNLYNPDGNLNCDLKMKKDLLKEYNDFGNLEFEGEYLNGKRNGKGKEYIAGILEFEGEYLNGQKNGKGKEYNYNGKLEFEGEYLNGEKNGKGKEFYSNGKLKFEGIYLNGNKWEGIGYDCFLNIVYKLQNGKGFIKLFDDNNNIEFEGEYLNGYYHGKGKKYY